MLCLRYWANSSKIELDLHRCTVLWSNVERVLRLEDVFPSHRVGGIQVFAHFQVLKCCNASTFDCHTYSRERTLLCIHMYWFGSTFTQFKSGSMLTSCFPIITHAAACSAKITWMELEVPTNVYLTLSALHKLIYSHLGMDGLVAIIEHLKYVQCQLQHWTTRTSG